MYFKIKRRDKMKKKKMQKEYTLEDFGKIVVRLDDGTPFIAFKNNKRKKKDNIPLASQIKTKNH